jgi:hypothetical protein
LRLGVRALEHMNQHLADSVVPFRGRAYAPGFSGIWASTLKR